MREYLIHEMKLREKYWNGCEKCWRWFCRNCSEVNIHLLHEQTCTGVSHIQNALEKINEEHHK